ncbi:MAG: GntR family transcriptional regulator [Lachnospiraceae bacterium]|nr:GntR family transcriptional regulator [Lachnospiraceae bacterium]
MKRCDRRENENNREYAYRTLRQNIMTLQMFPGTTISEADIADRLGISRTPVHEAIAKLKEELLIEIFPQSGTRISRIDVHIMKEGYFLRSIVEPKLVEQLAGNVGQEGMQLLNENLEKQKELIEQGVQMEEKAFIDDFFKIDDRFHKIIYDLAGKPHVWTAVRSVCSHCDRIRYMDAMKERTNLEAIYEEHKILTGYLLLGIPNQVELRKFYADHLGTYQKQFFKLIEANPEYFSGI